MSEKGIEDFNKAKKLTLFRKTIYTMHKDYEFMSNKLGEDFSLVETLPAYAKISLYFNKINNDTCREVVTGKMFYRTDDNSFYNESTGLYFDFNDYFEKAVAHEKIINNKEYKLFVINYFNKYEIIKKSDDKRINKAMNLMLSNGKKFIRG